MANSNNTIDISFTSKHNENVVSTSNGVTTITPTEVTDTYSSKLITSDSINNVSTLGTTYSDPTKETGYTETFTDKPNLADYFSINSQLTESDKDKLEYFKELLKLLSDMSKEVDSTDSDTSWHTDIKYVDPEVLTRNVKVDTMEYTVTGDGLFDILMDTATKHIKAQFDANRIRQEDYANAYLEIYKVTLQAALQAWTTSVDYEHKKAEVDLVKAQARLVLIQALGESNKPAQLLAQIKQIESQIKHQDAQTDLVKAQTKQALFTAENLVPKQVDLIDAQAKVQTKQIDIAEAQSALITQQTISEKAKELLLLRQKEGFDENYNKEILKTCLDSWAVAFSVAKDSVAPGDTIPYAISKVSLDNIYNKFVRTELNAGTDSEILSDIESTPFTS